MLLLDCCYLEYIGVVKCDLFEDLLKLCFWLSGARPAAPSRLPGLVGPLGDTGVGFIEREEARSTLASVSM